MDNPITVSLPQDLPTNWVYGQTIGPNGTDVGLTQQHGYNYLMTQVNAAQQAAEELGEKFPSLYGIGSVIPVSDGGTGNSNGVAPSSSKLATARTILVNLASAAAALFDGTENVTPGVTGILPAANGGTGQSSLNDLVSQLVDLGVATQTFVQSKIAGLTITGSYTGTGTSGGTNPVKIAYPGAPPELIIIRANQTMGFNEAIGATLFTSAGFGWTDVFNNYAGYSPGLLTVELLTNEQTVSFYGASGVAANECNKSGVVYDYIGVCGGAL